MQLELNRDWIACLRCGCRDSLKFALAVEGCVSTQVTSQTGGDLMTLHVTLILKHHKATKCKVNGAMHLWRDQDPYMGTVRKDPAARSNLVERKSQRGYSKVSLSCAICWLVPWLSCSQHSVSREHRHSMSGMPQGHPPRVGMLPLIVCWSVTKPCWSTSNLHPPPFHNIQATCFLERAFAWSSNVLCAVVRRHWPLFRWIKCPEHHFGWRLLGFPDYLDSHDLIQDSTRQTVARHLKLGMADAVSVEHSHSWWDIEFSWNIFLFVRKIWW